MAARARRNRGRVRFQKDLDAEIRRLRIRREHLEDVIAAMVEVKAHRMARMRADDQEFTVVARVNGREFLAMSGATRDAYVEMLAAAGNVLKKKFIDGLREAAIGAK